MIDDIRIMGLSDLISCKLKLGRKKDRQDVELIRVYQQQQKQLHTAGAHHDRITVK
jgi:hypothetical protein